MKKIIALSAGAAALAMPAAAHHEAALIHSSFGTAATVLGIASVALITGYLILRRRNENN